MPSPMHLIKIKSDGLAHLSYLLIHKGQAAVIDPRRDTQVYFDKALEHTARITHIFETHRNEDYVIGSKDLARRTGADIHHGAAQEFEYGQATREGDTFAVGDLTLKILETPGHTFESLSIMVYDTSAGEETVAVFSGDALFVGDVGRTDFFPDRAEEVAGLLYDSLHEKLLPLGDQTILLPAHGAGSVCGGNMSPREFSTLGHERLTNPRLQLDRDAFIRAKVSENHYQPPYFKKMEEYNLKGNAPSLWDLPRPAMLQPDEFAELSQDGMVIVDTRSPEAFAGSFLPDSLSIPMDMIPSFAGWLLSYEDPIGLIMESSEHTDICVRYLLRLGFDSIAGYLGGGVSSWHVSGRMFDSITTIYAAELRERIESGEDFTLLDVRKIDEYEQKHLPRATHIYLGELPDRLDEIPRDKPIVTMCGSGKRAMIAASILKRAGFDDVADNLGSIAACSEIGCPMEE